MMTLDPYRAMSVPDVPGEITLEGSGIAGNSNGTIDLSIAKAGFSLVTGDFMVSVWSLSGNADARAGIHSTWTELYSGGALAPHMKIHHHTIADPDDEPTNWTIPGGSLSTRGHYFGMYQFRGVDGGDPIDVAGPIVQANDSNPTIASITTVTDNAYVLGATAGYNGGANGSNWTPFGAPSQGVALHQNAHTRGSQQTAGFVQATAGATGTLQFFDDAGTDDNIKVMFALKPA